MPLAGVTVIVQGPQGEDATLTDDKGDYRFISLAVGTYVIRFYAANTSTQVEQPGVVVSADKTVRVNAASRSAAAGRRAADLRHHRQGAHHRRRQRARRRDVRRGLHAQRPARAAPTATSSSRRPAPSSIGSGNVSIGGATGLENIYIVNGMNVTGMRVRQPRGGRPPPSAAARTFRSSSSPRSTSTAAATRPSSAARWAASSTPCSSRAPTSSTAAPSAPGRPTGWPAIPNAVITGGSSIGQRRKPDFDTSIGVEVGGPIIKNKLFFWVGFAPRFTDTHVLRLTYALQDKNGDRHGRRSTLSGAADHDPAPLDGTRSTSRTRPTTTPGRWTSFRARTPLTLRSSGRPLQQRARQPRQTASRSPPTRAGRRKT